MSFPKIVLLALLLPLAACVPPLPTAPASNAIYVPPAANVASGSASIAGTGQQDTSLPGTSASQTYVIAIDGKPLSSAEATSTISISAGRHLLIVGSTMSRRPQRATLLLNAKAETAYVIKTEFAAMTLNASAYNLGSDGHAQGPGELFHIEAIKDGTLAGPKISSIVFDNTNRYSEPTVQRSPTIIGSRSKESMFAATAYIQSIDGAFVNGEGKTTLWSNEVVRHETAVAITPGPHLISVGLASGLIGSSFPIPFTATPNTNYILKSEPAAAKNWNGRIIYTITFWIEDAASKTIIYPKTEVPAEGF